MDQAMTHAPNRETFETASLVRAPAAPDRDRAELPEAPLPMPEQDLERHHPAVNTASILTRVIRFGAVRRAS